MKVVRCISKVIKLFIVEFHARPDCLEKRLLIFLAHCIGDTLRKGVKITLCSSTTHLTS